MTSNRDFVGVSQQFLRKDYFRKAWQIMLKRKIILKQLTQFIKQIYDRWIVFANKADIIGKKTLQDSSFKWFKSIMDKKVFLVFNKIMNFQSKQLQKALNDKQSQSGFDVILSSLTKYIQAQKQYKQVIFQFRRVVNQQQKRIISVNQETTNEIISSFSQQQQSQRLTKLEKSLQEITDLRQKGEQQIIDLELQRATFVQQALKFRQTLCSNRGQILQKFKQTCEHTIFGFMTMFTALKQSIKSTKTKKHDTTIYMPNLSMSRIQLQSSIRLQTKQNYGQIISFVNYIKQIANLFKQFCNQFKQQINQVQKILLDNIISSFHVSQSSFDDVSVLFDTLKNAFSRIQNISFKINQKYNELQKSTQQIDKLNQIVLTLNKSPSKDFDKEENRNKKRYSGNQQQTLSIIDKINQVTFDILKIIEDQSELFVVWTESHHLSLDSISNISHVQSVSNISSLTFIDMSQQQNKCKEVQIKPVEELWLWEDWKDQETYRVPIHKYQYLKNVFKKMKVYENDIKNQPQKSQDCVFLLLNSKGKLQIRQKTIRFVSDNYVGKVAFSEIQKVFIKSVNDKDVLYLMSKKGLLRFENMEKIEEIKSIIKQRALKGTESKFISRISTNFNNYQPGFISIDQEKQFVSESRNIKSSKILPNLLTFKVFLSINLEDTTLVTFFRQCLSDVDVNIDGKVYSNLLIYSFSQKQSKPATQTKWNPQPPTYFTGLSGNPITSKLLFSQKIIQFQKTSSVEFPKIPTILHVKKYIKIYWVSKQRLILQIKTVHTNSFYANDSVIQGIIDICEINRNIQIKCYNKIALLKDFEQKQSLINFIRSEIQQNSQKYIQAVKLKLGKFSTNIDMINEKNASEETKQQREERVTLESDPKKILLIILISFLGIWILNRIL